MKVCSPDYTGMNKDEAVQDFMRRIEHYNSMYETLDHQIDKELSYIQIFNQGERFMVHKLAGRASAGACYGSCWFNCFITIFCGE